MRLTSFTDYGLRMLMRMASAPERAFSTAELAEEHARRWDDDNGRRQGLAGLDRGESQQPVATAEVTSIAGRRPDPRPGR